MPHVNEVNAIAKELEKHCSFEIVLVCTQMGNPITS